MLVPLYNENVTSQVPWLVWVRGSNTINDNKYFRKLGMASGLDGMRGLEDTRAAGMVRGWGGGGGQEDCVGRKGWVG